MDSLKYDYEEKDERIPDFRVFDACWSMFDNNKIYVRALTGDIEPYGNSVIQLYLGRRKSSSISAGPISSKGPSSGTSLA